RAARMIADRERRDEAGLRVTLKSALRATSAPMSARFFDAERRIQLETRQRSSGDGRGADDLRRRQSGTAELVPNEGGGALVSVADQPGGGTNGAIAARVDRPEDVGGEGDSIPRFLRVVGDVDGRRSAAVGALVEERLPRRRVPDAVLVEEQL